jgi:hypothetical protein
MKVALAHKCHVHTPDSVHVTPKHVKKETTYEKKDLELVHL